MSLPTLHTPEDLAEAWGKTAEWWAGEARARRIPHRRVGRSIRFSDDDVALILAQLANEPAAPDRSGLSSRSRNARRARISSAA